MALLSGSVEPVRDGATPAPPALTERVQSNAVPVAPERPVAAVPVPSSVAGYPVSPAADPRTLPGTPSVSKAQIIEWTRRNTPDDVIIERITASRAIFQVTAADQNELRDLGVSRAVIRAMKDTMRR